MFVVERIGSAEACADVEAGSRGRASAAPHWPPWPAGCWLALGLLAATAFGLALPYLPSGVCLGDSGELQLAGTVLGIAHSPGYAAYTSIAHLATWIPGVNPAYAVTLLCLAAGVITMTLSAMLAIRLGANPWAACAAGLALSAHPRVWQNVISPEVYIFSIAFLLGAAYLMTRYLRLGRRRDLLLAAFLLGVTIANRPPVVLAAPFFLWTWWANPHRTRTNAKTTVATLGLLVTSASLPGVYSTAYFFIRDTPTTSYNYMDHHNAESADLPLNTEGFASKVHRMAWLVSGREFYYLVGNDWGQVRAKLRWLRYEIVGRELPAGAAVLLLALVGLLRAFQRFSGTAWLLCGIAFQALFYILNCRNSGQAADLLPVLIPMAVLSSAGFSEALGVMGVRSRGIAAIAVFVLTLLVTLRDLPHRTQYGASVDATGFLADTRLADLPKDSIVLTGWTHAAPLLYEQIVRTHRHDLRIIIAQPQNWLRLADQFPDRRVYVSQTLSILEPRRPTLNHNLWLLGPKTDPSPAP